MIGGRGLWSAGPAVSQFGRRGGFTPPPGEVNLPPSGEVNSPLRGEMMPPSGEVNSPLRI